MPAAGDFQPADAERIARLFERANTILARCERRVRAWTALSDAAQACTERGTALVHSRRALDSANRLVASHESVSLLSLKPDGVNFLRVMVMMVNGEG